MHTKLDVIKIGSVANLEFSYYINMVALTYLHPTSSSVTFFPSTIVKAPIPGNTSDFRISVPIPVALIRHTCADSNADCPWSPHSLKTYNYRH